MTAMLTDDELDEMLTGAAARVRAAAADVAIGATPSPSFPTATVLRVAAAVAVVGGAAAGLFAVGTSGGGTEVPAAFTRGDYGSEIVLRRDDDGDGDGDPNTERLVLDPGGRSVRVLSGAAASEYAGDPTMTSCWQLDDSSAICGPEQTAALYISRSRGPDALALVLRIPDDVAAVAFDGGAVRAWQRPVNGTAVFPYPVDASGVVAATLVRADGTAVDMLEASDPTPTDAERTTTLDARTLPSTPVVGAPPADFAPPVTYLRRRGRTGGATGFDGPFLLQSFDNGAGGTDGMIATVTVRADEADEARERLVAAHPTAYVVTEVANPGVVTLLWAGSAVPAEAVLAVADGLRVGSVPATASDLDRTYSWTGPSDTSMFRFVNSRPVEAMLFDDVGVVGTDGRTLTIRAGGDDAGTVRFWLAAPEDTMNSIDGSGTASVPVGSGGQLPDVGELLTPGLWAVPSSTTSLSITLSDGRVVTPELVDVRPVADVKLAVLPAQVKDLRVDAVSTT